jgi:hypothetical protein
MVYVNRMEKYVLHLLKVMKLVQLQLVIKVGILAMLFDKMGESNEVQ